MEHLDLENKIIFFLETGRSLEAGMPLVRAMEIAGYRTIGYEEEVKKLVKRIGEGDDLTGALEKEGYPRVIVALARIGGEGGAMTLEKGMYRIADYLKEERGRQIREEIVIYESWADLLDYSRLSLGEVLGEVLDYISDAKLKEGFEYLKEGVEEGKPLHELTGKYEEVFDEQIATALKVGELRMGLSKSLRNIVERLEYRLKRPF